MKGHMKLYRMDNNYMIDILYQYEKDSQSSLSKKSFFGVKTMKFVKYKFINIKTEQCL